MLAFLCALAFQSYALTHEQQAYDACKKYIALGKEKLPNETFLSCEGLNRSAKEWHCMIDRQIYKNWSYYDSQSSCFKSAPALSTIEKQLANTPPLKASEICGIAYDLFIQNGEDIPMNRAETCSNTTRNAAMWVCMASFAKSGNSFMFSTGQCFPRQKIA